MKGVRRPRTAPADFIDLEHHRAPDEYRPPFWDAHRTPRGTSLAHATRDVRARLGPPRDRARAPCGATSTPQMAVLDVS